MTCRHLWSAWKDRPGGGQIRICLRSMLCAAYEVKEK